MKIRSSAAFLVVAQMFAAAEGFSLGHTGSFVGLPRKAISQLSSSPLLRLVANIYALFCANFQKDDYLFVLCLIYALGAIALGMKTTVHSYMS
jgi:hypothetical protein